MLCREWRSAAEYWHGPMQSILEQSTAASAAQAVQEAVAGAPAEGVRQFLVSRKAATCDSTVSSTCTQPAVVGTVGLPLLWRWVLAVHGCGLSMLFLRLHFYASSPCQLAVRFHDYSHAQAASQDVKLWSGCQALHNSGGALHGIQPRQGSTCYTWRQWECHPLDTPKLPSTSA